MISFQFSRLTEDLSAVLTTLHERRNSLAPINRLPLDVLCLIPTHLTSLPDRLRVTFVCRHWRSIFVQHAALWSQLYLDGITNLLLVRTLLERAKGAPLDITVDYYKSTFRDLTLLTPSGRQIRSLELKKPSSYEVQDLSTAISGPLPLLHTLEIDLEKYLDGYGSLVTPVLPLFEGAVNLKNFVLNLYHLPSLPRFTFPNLTTLTFSTNVHEFPVSQLLDFLEASSALQQIRMDITTDRFREDVPPERVIVLSDVKTFSLETATDGPGHKITTHVSCPFANTVELTHMLGSGGGEVPEDAYPPSISWHTITRQYARGAVERVVLEMTIDDYIDCSITFRSSDGAILKLRYFHGTTTEYPDTEMSLGRSLPVVFSQALRTIRDHPLLSSIKHLYIKGGGIIIHDLGVATEGVGRLLGSMGPLESLTLDSCDLRPYLDAFLDTPLFPEAIQPTSFPPIKEFAIIHPMHSSREELYGLAIVEFARSQEARGIRIERLKFFFTGVPSLLMDELVAFVDAVECCDKTL